MSADARTQGTPSLGRVLARRPAAEVGVDEQDPRLRELGLVERVRAAFLLFGDAVVFEGVIAQAFERHRAEEASGDDAVGIDVVATNGDAGPGDANAFAVHR